MYIFICLYIYVSWRNTGAKGCGPVLHEPSLPATGAIGCATHRYMSQQVGLFDIYLFTHMCFF